MKKIVDPEIFNIAFALTTKKTLKKWSLTHYCREHKQFLKGEHLDCFSLLDIKEFSNFKPTHFKDWWDK